MLKMYSTSLSIHKTAKATIFAYIFCLLILILIVGLDICWCESLPTNASNNTTNNDFYNSPLFGIILFLAASGGLYIFINPTVQAAILIKGGMTVCEVSSNLNQKPDLKGEISNVSSSPLKVTDSSVDLLKQAGPSMGEIPSPALSEHSVSNFGSTVQDQNIFELLNLVEKYTVSNDAFLNLVYTSKDYFLSIKKPGKQNVLSILEHAENNAADFREVLEKMRWFVSKNSGSMAPESVVTEVLKTSSEVSTTAAMSLISNQTTVDIAINVLEKGL